MIIIFFFNRYHELIQSANPIILELFDLGSADEKTQTDVLNGLIQLRKKICGIYFLYSFIHSIYILVQH